MPNIQKLKMDRLQAQTERDILINEVMRGTLVRWEDIKGIFSVKIMNARNKILAIPSMFAEKLTREEIEQMRLALNAALIEASKVASGEAREKKPSTRYIRVDDRKRLQKSSQPFPV